MRRVSYLPNLLSSLRIALAPAMLGAAYSNAKAGFAVLLAVAMATDVLDGYFARRWRAESEMGHRLDHWGDGLTVGLGAVGIFFLWPQAVEDEWPWMLAALVGYIFSGVKRLSRPAAAKMKPNGLVKLACWLVPMTLLPLIMQWTPWPFRAAALVQLVIGGVRILRPAAVEGIALDRREAGAKG
jgi:CDP-diacylglycerol--glycerol-3-phosphate 3-phosphatidyltransferase